MTDLPSPSAQGSAVELVHVDKSFGTQPVLKHLSLSVAAGEFLAVLGPSGSGKTTMMRIVAGFETPDAGAVLVGGAEVSHLPAERRSVNTVFQSYALFPHLSVLDNIGFGPRMRGVGKAERDRTARRLLDLVQLPDAAGRMPRELSGGMQQRVALARALANAPAVLLLDEPLGALDRKLRLEMQGELRRIHRELGTTFIYVTHDQEEAFGLADRLAVMRDGRFVQIGLPGEVYDHPADAWVSDFLGGGNAIPVRLDGDGRLQSAFGSIAAAYVDKGLRPGDAAVAVIRPEATRIGPAGDAAPNCFAGQLRDRVVAGPTLRLTASAATGTSFDAIVPRDLATAALNLGDAVTISFDPASVRVYPAPGTLQPERSFMPKSFKPDISRRSLLAMMGAAPAAAALSQILPSQAFAAGALNIYSWPDYFSTDDLAAYAKKSGVTPNISTYNDNGALFAKLNSPAGAGFDIAVPSSGWIKQLAEKSLLLELDHSRIDLSALDQSLLNRDYDPYNKYSIPKDWGLLGVVYDPAVVGEIKTWQDFFDAGAKPEVSGKVRLTKDAGETVGPALWVAGKDWNTATPDEIRGTKDFLKAFAKHVKTFSGFDPAALANGSIVLAQANQAAARGAIQQNPKLKWVVPGPHSEIWVDSYSIPAAAENVDQAYDFLNFFLSPEIQVKETEYLGYPAAIAGLQGKLSPETKNADLIFGGSGLDFSALTSFIVNPDTIDVFQEVQNEVQAAAGA